MDPKNSSSTQGGGFLETVLTIRFSNSVFCEVNSELCVHNIMLFTADNSHTSHVFNTISHTLLKRDFHVFYKSI
jgi:hypothetical protein